MIFSTSTLQALGRCDQADSTRHREALNSLHTGSETGLNTGLNIVLYTTLYHIRSAPSQSSETQDRFCGTLLSFTLRDDERLRSKKLVIILKRRCYAFLNYNLLAKELDRLARLAREAGRVVRPQPLLALSGRLRKERSQDSVKMKSSSALNQKSLDKLSLTSAPQNSVGQRQNFIT